MRADVLMEQMEPLRASEEEQIRQRPACQRSRSVLGGVLAVAGFVGAVIAWVGPRALQTPDTIAEGDSIRLDGGQLQDNHSRCLYPDSFEAGANLSLGYCENVSNQFFVVKDSVIMLGNSDGEIFCVTLGKYDEAKEGKPLHFEKCISGYYRQRIAGFCLFGEGDKNGPAHSARAYGQYCKAQESVSRPLMGPSLFCFMAVLPDSGEVALKDAAASRGASIFACDESKVYQSWPTSQYHTPDGDFTANIDVFIAVWKQVWDDEIYKSHDWTVKVDPDTVWVPDRLRGRLLNLGTKIDEPVYVKNTWKSFGFLGPIEILSQTAVARLAEMNISEECGYYPSGGEDGWLKDCMDNKAMIGWKEDVNILYSGCQVDRCGDHNFVAYHYYKDAGSWNDCMNRAW